MDELKAKEGALTPADLATYGIPPQRQPSKDPNLEAPGETEETASQRQTIDQPC